MRFFQHQRGKQALPFIMPGLLHNERVKMGDVDDIAEARNETLDNLYISADKQRQKITQIDGTITQIDGTTRKLSTELFQTTSSTRRNSNNLELLRKENVILKQNIENLNKEYHKKHDDNQELIQKLAVRIEQLENQIKANSKSIRIRKKYAVRKTKENELRFEELTKKLAKCMPFPKLLPLKSIKIIDNTLVQSELQPINHDSGEDTVDD